MVFWERCLESLHDLFEKCTKRRHSLQRAEKEAYEKCEEDTKVLQRRVNQLDDSMQRELEQLHTCLGEALSAMQENADATTEQIQWEVHALKKQADLDIARIRMSSRGRGLSEDIMAAKCYALNGDPMKEARSRYLSAYEEAIKTHEASLMAEDMELVALHLSWRTERVNSMQSCKLDLDEKWAQRIYLCWQRATSVRTAYEASKRSCKDDLQTGYVAAANELSRRRKARRDKGAKIDTKAQKLVDAIIHKRDQEVAKLKVKIEEIEEERRRQTKKLRDDHKAQRSSLKHSVWNVYQPLLSAIEERSALLGRERDVILKDLRAVQATLTLVTSAIHTLGRDPTSRLDTYIPRPLSNPFAGACMCGCGRRRRLSHRDQRPSESPMGSFPHLSKNFSSDSRQHTYKKFEEQQQADESRRQREADEEVQRRFEERFKRERDEQRRKEAKEQARAERDARERAEREQAKTREAEEARKREEEARRKWEEEERRKAEENQRAKEEEERRQKAEEEARKHAEEEEKRHRENARKREEEESRRRDEERRRREDEDRQKHQQQQQSKSHGGGDARSAAGEGEVDDGDHSRGTSSRQTHRGTSFVHKCWAKYTEAWTRLMASAVSKIKFQEIPWPIVLPGKRRLTSMSIADILFRINKEAIRTFLLAPAQLQSISAKARIRKELLRFHPDKRTQWLKNVKDEERGQVDEACKQVILHLTDLLNTAT